MIEVTTRETEGGNVYLLLNGKAILRKHSVEDPFDFSILSIVRPGLFIGAQELDMCQSSLPHVWAIVSSHSANFLVIPRSEFD